MTVSKAGLLVTLFALTVAAVGPILTARVVGFERKKLFLFTLLLFALSNGLAAFAPNIVLMAVARLLPALMLPVFWSLASETAVQITGPEHAGKAISMVSFGVVGATIFSLIVFAGMFTAYTYLADILEKLAGFSGSTVGWILMGFGGVGLIGNWAGGRMVDRHALRASILFCIPLAIGLCMLVPFMKWRAVLAFVLIVWGFCQAALITSPIPAS